MDQLRRRVDLSSFRSVCAIQRIVTVGRPARQQQRDRGRRSHSIHEVGDQILSERLGVVLSEAFVQVHRRQHGVAETPHACAEDQTVAGSRLGPSGVTNVNSVFGVKNQDGSMTVKFGQFNDEQPNTIPTPEGWNLLIRLYRPRLAELAEWTVPTLEPVP
jgi:hypothetical protein